jgi:hypothetical protein
MDWYQCSVQSISVLCKFLSRAPVIGVYIIEFYTFVVSLLTVLEMIQGEYVENVKVMSAEIQNGKLNKKLDPVVVARSVANSDSLKALTKIRK